jgi:hypothetical protein
MKRGKAMSATRRGFSVTGVFLLGVASMLFGLLLPSGGRAGVIDVGIAETRVIADNAGHSRVLIRPGSLSAVRGELVTKAFLEFSLSGGAPVEEMRVRVYPLNRDWEGNSVSWNYPWTVAGGDVDDADFRTVDLPAGRVATKLRLDVSEIVRAMADGEIGEYGFLLTVPPFQGAGFNSTHLTTLGGLTSGKLVVHYRKISVLGFTGPGGSTQLRREAQADVEVGDRPARGSRTKSDAGTADPPGR